MTALNGKFDNLHVEARWPAGATAQLPIWVRVDCFPLGTAVLSAGKLLVGATASHCRV